ncbi:hypothetical protein HOY80DRAFT_967899 [Tuber brumale]|nr:hypothetical protein HOY80DRAFT_967899 [Tuber brumale]
MGLDIGWVISYHTFAVHFVGFLILCFGKRACGAVSVGRSGRSGRSGRIGGGVRFFLPFFLSCRFGLVYDRSFLHANGVVLVSYSCSFCL